MSDPMRFIDINADLGEGFPLDARLLELTTSASICCGAHAGSPETIRSTMKAARARGIPIGAHPGYPDRVNFGRLAPESPIDVKGLMLDQLETLRGLAESVGIPLRFIKPHGALYNQAQIDPEIARPVVESALAADLAIFGQPHSQVETIAAELGVRFVSEGFPDRRYGSNGRLVSRSRPDAILTDPGEFEAQVERLALSGVRTLCIHGDDPRAEDNARRLRAALDRLKIVPRFWGENVPQ
jgi:5-oxoprolinase (ATP-hydrolysing) subunit A